MKIQGLKRLISEVNQRDSAKKVVCYFNGSGRRETISWIQETQILACLIRENKVDQSFFCRFTGLKTLGLSARVEIMAAGYKPTRYEIALSEV